MDELEWLRLRCLRRKYEKNNSPPTTISNRAPITAPTTDPINDFEPAEDRSAEGVEVGVDVGGVEFKFVSVEVAVITIASSQNQLPLVVD